MGHEAVFKVLDDIAMADSMSYWIVAALTLLVFMVMRAMLPVKGLAAVRGYRGLPKGDVAALARAVVAFSRLAGLAEVSEAEINPVLVLRDGEGVVMADALLALG